MPTTKQKISLVIVLGLLLAWGCSKPADVAVNSGTSPSAKPADAAADTSIVGDYEADPASAIDNSTDKKDPAAEMGKSLASMLGKMKLKVDEGDTFTLTMMGMKLEGKYTRSGNHLTFTPDHIMGMTIEQFKAAEAKNSGSMAMDDSMTEPMEGDFLPTGEIKTTSKGKGTGGLTFKKAEPEKPVPMTLKTDEEKALVGEWKGAMELPANATDKDKEGYEMMKGMMQSLALDLRQNGTFKLNVMIEFQGDWKLEGKKLSLQPSLGSGMGGSDKPMTLTVSDDGKSMVMDDQTKGKLTFTKN
jgi:hypothetical protein